ncbi:Crp/Fnr family transcriptional regulator [Listeria booriae]|uniref:Crp/Fnr family transcriptional regulator n=1 Tax=Listeria booriae TaxID=1552123 RepID=A0A7X0ZX54_9LIST|nr:Crp/Fnr family transcriptional regulator [Listeria booriae]MBC2312180.1 Crp/Fnr family transcriptional regulator [Listeria booriae]
MYPEGELASLASFSNVMKLLKKDAHFNKFCTQHRLPKDNVEVITDNMKYAYLLQNGYLSYTYTGKIGSGYFFIVVPGMFVNLPISGNQVPIAGKVRALTDIVWWKIDIGFLRKMLLTEDPRNHIMLNYALQTRYYLYLIVKKYHLTSAERVYFSLLRCTESGIQVKDNQAELPLFITYDLLAEFSETSKSYTSRVLADLRNKGILQSSKKPWVITDVAYLRKLVDVEDDLRPLV